MKNLSQERGQQAERLAEKLLRSKGFKILVRNFSCKYGEIDLIGVDGNCLVFVEVKARYSPKWGSAQEAVSRVKWEKIARVGEYFCQMYPASLPQAKRIDVVGFENEAGKLVARHYENTTP